jgi:acyl-CoA synthetase (AMP-forming)/AMP-acid ligase II
MFISGGSNIYPREVEEALLTHPDVLECAVLGLPHPRWGEAGVACVVPRPGHSPEPAALLAHLAPLLARYKHPQRIVLWEALPRSAYGKVPKALLRERLAREGIGFMD